MVEYLVSSLLFFEKGKKERTVRSAKINERFDFTKRFTIMFILMRYKFASDRRAGIIHEQELSTL